LSAVNSRRMASANACLLHDCLGLRFGLKLGRGVVGPSLVAHLPALVTKRQKLHEQILGLSGGGGPELDGVDTTNKTIAPHHADDPAGRPIIVFRTINSRWSDLASSSDCSSLKNSLDLRCYSTVMSHRVRCRSDATRGCDVNNTGSALACDDAAGRRIAGLTAIASLPANMSAASPARSAPATLVAFANAARGGVA
jgi:hypothetical protein